MRLQLLIGPAGLSEPPGPDVSEGDSFLFTEDAADHYGDLIEGSRLVASPFGFAAWDEPAADLFLEHVDGLVLSRLRRAAAHLALHGRLPETESSAFLFLDDTVSEAWQRGPEHFAAGHAITGTARIGAYDHFLHHTGEPLIYSPADFAPVIKDDSAPGGLVPSAARMLAEVEELERAMGAGPDSEDARALRVLGEAARTAVAAGAGLLTDYV